MTTGQLANFTAADYPAPSCSVCGETGDTLTAHGDAYRCPAHPRPAALLPAAARHRLPAPARWALRGAAVAVGLFLTGATLGWLTAPTLAGILKTLAGLAVAVLAALVLARLAGGKHCPGIHCDNCPG